MGQRIKWHRGGYGLLMISPLLPDKWGLVAIYTFIFLFILSRKRLKPSVKLKKGQKWILWLCISFFLFYGLSLLWGHDLLTGIKSVEKKLLFLVLPALFLIGGKGVHDLRNSVRIFIGCVNLALLACLAISIYQAMIYTGFQTWPFKYYNFTYWIGVHPGYLSLLVLLSLVCTGFTLKEKKGHGKMGWATLIFQSFMLFFIGAKFAILCFLLSSVLFLFLFRFQRKQIMIGAAALVFIVFFALYFSVNSWNRMANVKETLADRIELDQVGIGLFLEKGIIGYGAGNVDQKLSEEYERLNIKQAQSNNYNIHNQYLQVLLATGIVGFAILMAPIVLALKFADNRLFAFLLLLQFLAFFAIESALVRQKGVVTFVTWLLFITLYTYQEQLSLSDNED